MGGVRLQGEISGSARPIYSKDEAQEWRKTGMLHLCASFEPNFRQPLCDVATP
jgi:hypothetical protein